VADEALSLLDVDPLGLDDIDRRVVRTIIENSKAVRSAGHHRRRLSEEPDTIMDVVEPYLLQLVSWTAPRVAACHRRAYEHLGIPYQPPPQPGLF